MNKRLRLPSGWRWVTTDGLTYAKCGDGDLVTVIGGIVAFQSGDSVIEVDIPVVEACLARHKLEAS